MDVIEPIRSTKRKLEQAFNSLDEAVTPSDGALPPSKRIHTFPSHSLYSTLAKYGVNFKEAKQHISVSNFHTYHSSHQSEALAKRTPHLSAILSRTASRKQTALSFRLGNHSASSLSLSSIAEYRPSSVSSFLSRLTSYKLSTYANKPPVIDAVAAAKCGWVNDGKDRLVCGMCKSSWVVAGCGGMSRGAATAFVEKQRALLVDAHKNGCPWKSRQCSDSIYRIPLNPPAAMLRELKQNAIILRPLLEEVVTKHPLTSKQLNSLRAITASLSLSPPFESRDHEDRSASRPGSPEPENSCPPDNAILASLFGWLPVPFTRRQTSSSGSVPSSAPPRVSSSSHGTSISYQSTHPGMTTFSADKPNMVLHENSMLYCPLCQRRVGLWAFAPQTEKIETGRGNREALSPASGMGHKPAVPQRPFDVLKEHRSFCPYVARSTPVPSITKTQEQDINVHQEANSFPPDTIEEKYEGWRAVLTTVLRYGMKERMVYDILINETPTQNNEVNEPTEVDMVKAMVTGVKNRGGRDLLKYVKSLLG